MVDVRMVILGLDVSTHAHPDTTEKTVLLPVLLVAMGHVAIKMENATIVKMSGKVIALKTIEQSPVVYTVRHQTICLLLLD